MPGVRVTWLVGWAVALAFGATTALAGASGATVHGPAFVRFADATLGPVARSSAAASPFEGTSGGSYTTPGGDSVEVYSDTGYSAQDPAFNQRWADFLATAPHGDELAARHRRPQAARRGAGALWRALARLLLPRLRGDRLARHGPLARRSRDRRPAARVRPPHRPEPRQRPLAGRRLRPEALGIGQERLPADRERDAPPGRRGRRLPPQPGRGVGGDLPCLRRTHARPCRRAVDDREQLLLPGRRGIRGRCRGHPGSLDVGTRP